MQQHIVLVQQDTVLTRQGWVTEQQATVAFRQGLVKDKQGNGILRQVFALGIKPPDILRNGCLIAC